MSTPKKPRGSDFTKSFLARDERLRAFLSLAATKGLSGGDFDLLMLLLIDGPLRRYDKTEATYTRIQIAQTLGIEKAHVSRRLSRLEDAGLISRISRPGPKGKVTISVLLPSVGDSAVPSTYPFQVWLKEPENGAESGTDTPHTPQSDGAESGTNSLHNGAESGTDSARIGARSGTTYQERETLTGESDPQENVCGPVSQPPSGSHLHQVPSSLCRGSARDDGGRVSEEWMLEELVESLSKDGRGRLTKTRRHEVVRGLTSLRLMDPSLSDVETLYLLGFWAGDRLLANANHLPENAMRHRAEAQALAESLAQQEPQVCLQWGYQHGTAHREGRAVE